MSGLPIRRGQPEGDLNSTGISSTRGSPVGGFVRMIFLELRFDPFRSRAERVEWSKERDKDKVTSGLREELPQRTPKKCNMHV
jgi:hypothetical protein